jgi:NADPH:quinone reductase-like Zn-dependent oxidoreductase
MIFSSGPYVLGFDFSGDMVEQGAEGREDGNTLTMGQQLFGRSLTGGTFAEYVVVKKEHVLPRGRVPAPEASTFGIAYLTAYESLVISANIERHKGKWIYVAGAAGGVGHFAAQIAKLYGLKVIGSAGKAASLNLLRQLHLDHIIDYSKQDVVKEIMSVTGGKGADLVYDSTYTQSSYTQSAAAVASGGEYIRLGTAAQLALSGAEDTLPGFLRIGGHFKNPYLGSLIEGISGQAKYMLVAGGGLTVIANAPNPAGVALLRNGFNDESIGAGGLLLGVFLPTTVAALFFML